MSLNWTVETDPFSIYFQQDLPLRVVVGVTCVLAIFGSTFVILSYVCFKDFRTHARQILLNLSLMDFGIGLGNLIGMLIDFDRFYLSKNATTGAYTGIQDVSTAVDVTCQTQAVFSHFVTLGSVLWTMSLAVYMFVLTFQNERKARYYLPACYVASYGVPALVCAWMAATKRFGYAPYNSAGWCSLIINKPFAGGSTKTDYFPIVIAYDLWIFLAIIITATVYVAIFRRFKEVSRTSLKIMRKMC